MDALSVVMQLRRYCVQHRPTEQEKVRLPKVALALREFLVHADLAVRHEAARALQNMASIHQSLLLDATEECKILLEVARSNVNNIDPVISECSQTLLKNLANNVNNAHNCKHSNAASLDHRGPIYRIVLGLTVFDISHGIHPTHEQKTAAASEIQQRCATIPGVRSVTASFNSHSSSAFTKTSSGGHEALFGYHHHGEAAGVQAGNVGNAEMAGSMGGAIAATPAAAVDFCVGESMNGSGDRSLGSTTTRCSSGNGSEEQYTPEVAVAVGGSKAAATTTAAATAAETGGEFSLSSGEMKGSRRNDVECVNSTGDISSEVCGLGGKFNSGGNEKVKVSQPLNLIARFDLFLIVSASLPKDRQERKNFIRDLKMKAGFNAVTLRIAPAGGVAAAAEFGGVVTPQLPTSAAAEAPTTTNFNAHHYSSEHQHSSDKSAMEIDESTSSNRHSGSKSAYHQNNINSFPQHPSSDEPAYLDEINVLNSSSSSSSHNNGNPNFGFSAFSSHGTFFNPQYSFIERQFSSSNNILSTRPEDEEVAKRLKEEKERGNKERLQKLDQSSVMDRILSKFGKLRMW